MKRRDEVWVGLLLTVATAVAILGTLWLARGGLQSGYPLRTRFAWGQNLKQGQPVLLAGVTVGYVDDVKLESGGYLTVLLRVNDDYQVPYGSTSKVQAVGLFGDVAVALDPPKQLTGKYYHENDFVPPGQPSPDMNTILARVDTIGRSVQQLTSALQSEMVDRGGLRDIRRMLASANETMTSANGLVLRLNGVVAEQNRNLTATMASLQRATSAVDSARIGATLANLQQTSQNTVALTQELTATSTRLNSLMTKLDQGEGTAGKLLSDTLLYRDLRNLVGRADSLTSDIKKNPRKYINLSIF